MEMEDQFTESPEMEKLRQEAGEDVFESEVPTAWIKIPIGDYIVLLKHHGVDIQSAEDMDRLSESYSPAALAQMMRAGIHLGLFPKSLLPDAKASLHAGDRMAVTQTVRAVRIARDIVTDKGPMRLTPARTVGDRDTYHEARQPLPGNGKDSPEAALKDLHIKGGLRVPIESEEGERRIRKEILRIIPSYLRSQFEKLIATGIPIGPIAEELKRLIDEMVEEYRGARPA